MSSKSQPIIEFVRVSKTKDRGILHRVNEALPRLVSFLSSYITINSFAILDALVAFIDYYPGQNFPGDSIIVEHPFAVLVHHEYALAE